jgi:hypothetical protein
MPMNSKRKYGGKRTGRAVLPSSWIIVGRVARPDHGVSPSYL